MVGHKLHFNDSIYAVVLKHFRSLFLYKMHIYMPPFITVLYIFYIQKNNTYYGLFCKKL